MASNAAYVRFTEINDEEEQEWNFYIPVKGNEKAIMALIEVTMNFQGYWVDDETVPEWKVDKLVESSEDDGGYYPAHNKLSGKLPIETFTGDGKDIPYPVDIHNALYKGGIQDMMQE